MINNEFRILLKAYTHASKDGDTAGLPLASPDIPEPSLPLPALERSAGSDTDRAVQGWSPKLNLIEWSPAS